jgi:hypothetical protein
VKAEYVALKGLMMHPGWAYLEQEWLAQITDIESARDKAAKKGTESAWRYWAGQEYGAKLMTQTARIAVERMEKADADLQERDVSEEILKEIGLRKSQ